MKLDIKHIPIALVLQINLDNDLVEPVLACEIQFDGGVSRRDVWLKDMPDDWIKKAEELIDEAVKILDE